MVPPAGSRRAAGSIVAGLALTVIALAFDASPLFVPGLAFVLMGGGTWAWVWLVAGGARIDRRLDTDRVVEGDPLEATIDVRGGRFGVGGAEIHDPLAGAPLLLRGRGRSAAVRVLASFDRRGFHALAPPTLVVRDPLVLAQRHARCLAKDQHVLVLPRTDRVKWRDSEGGNRLSAPRTPSRASITIAVEIDGLRPYQPGTPASRIHWPALARGAGLLERRLRADDDLRPLVILDTRGDGAIAPLDAAVRAAASLTLELARGGGCLLLLPGERRPMAIEPDLAAWPGALARLAVLEGGPSSPGPALSAARSRLGPVVYVSAVPLKRVPAALGFGTLVLVVPGERANRAIGRLCFEVSGCSGFMVGARSRPREQAA